MFYVVICNIYGTSEEVIPFETREEAVDYIAKLPEDIYMVILRNDNLSKPHFSIPQ